MSGMPEQDDSAKLLDDIGGLESAITRLEASFKKLTESASSFTSTMRGGIGGTVNATTAGTGGVGSSGPNFLQQSLSTVSPFVKMNAMRSTAFSVLGGTVQAIGGLAAGAFAAMPNVNAAMGMAQGEYYQGFMSGNNWRTVGRTTAGFLGNGQNIVGAAGAVSASLAAQGITFNGTKNMSGVYGGAGMYGSIARTIGSAAKLMNMPNDVAAQSIGSMYSGSTSMGLMQNFGIFTTDPNSGKSATPTQILAMIGDRLTGGNKMSYKEMQTALGPGGALSLDIQNSGLDANMQQMLRARMLAASKGSYINFDDPNSAAAKAALKAAGFNPSQASMNVTAASNQTMQTAVDSYVKGMNAASKAVVGFEHTLNNFLKSPFGKMFAQANGAMNLAGQSSAVTGAVTGALGVAAGAGTILSGIGNYRSTSRMLRGLGGNGGGLSWKNASATQRALGKTTGGANVFGRGAGKFLGKGMGWLGALTQLPNLIGDISSGKFKNAAADTGGMAGSVAGGSIGSVVGTGLGALIPILGETGIGEMLGGWAGGMAGSWLGGMAGSALGGMAGGALGLANGGQPSSVRTGSFGANNTTFKLAYPTKSKTITSPYGATGDSKFHSNGHKGVDFGVGQGTQVYAAADGIASAVFEYGYGQTVRIDHGNGFVTLYAHLSQAQVSNGQNVTTGQPIALSGNTGAWTTGAHLHFGVYKNGSPVDPAPLLGGVAGFANATNGFNDVSGESGGQTSSSTAGFTGSGIAAGAGSLGYSVTAGSYASASSINGASSAYSANPQTMSGGSNIGIGRAATEGGVGNQNTGGGAPDNGRRAPNVEINVTVAQASESEARRLAQMVKEYIQEDKLTYSMGRM